MTELEELRAQVAALTARVADLEEYNSRSEFLARKERELRVGAITIEQYEYDVRERFGFPEVDEP